MGYCSILLMVAAVVAMGGWVQAAPSSVSRQYLIGEGFICALAPNACPAIAKADNGDTVEITGSGTFTPKGKVATGGGKFVHKDPSGNVLGMGDWHAMGVIAFRSYGTDQSGELPESFEGGFLLLRVHLAPAAGGPGFLAVLQVDCLIGTPPAAAMEGVRLAVQDVINFNKEISGFTLYLLPA